MLRVVPRVERGERLNAGVVVFCRQRAFSTCAHRSAERFGWVVAPASTVIQPSQVHSRLTRDPQATLDRLLDALVGTPSR
ncbi:MAG: DUF3037 domain-containing protein [Actinobacteria bacterium]|nr:DUF3037 domain-containing protein [Actinomycetota bacterium]